MPIFTNQSAVHIYVGGYCFNQIKGKENAFYHPLCGVLKHKIFLMRQIMNIFQLQF
jgi:hypothetical protein